eukprot:PhF_6_TR33700/c0_g1_i2/m.49449
MAILCAVEHYKKPEPVAATPQPSELPFESPSPIHPRMKDPSLPLSPGGGKSPARSARVGSERDVRVAEFARIIYEQRAYIELLEARSQRCTCGAHDPNPIGTDLESTHPGVLMDALDVLR